ncbi:DUF1365 domain-containing protein [Leucothrix arctica]|uniref:DUF1365 domain-containing protein n=1 Tax=Leucothrix arctica TaxID=1481894 RepID=A0A317CAF4_9GAMM|nr:DUF1365 domain-containing protein [Leucothrix arctica]PWQ95357.1 DUF1365 domain-containing protein [Leucothrix arctica]
MDSAIYSGRVRHRRYGEKSNAFNYKLFLTALDLDELNDGLSIGRWFGVEKKAVLSFRHSDYLDGQGKLTAQKVWHKVESLGGENWGGKVTLLGQLRCFDIYFSPVNFYYCHDRGGELRYLVAEVSNTPWNERHCYLVEHKQNVMTDKTFHVSPFMNEDMAYRWRFTPLNPRLYLNIDNVEPDGNKLFDATIYMDKQAFTRSNLIKQLIKIPAMTVKTMLGIYWQAAKIYLKGISYVTYTKKSKELKK